MADITLKTLGSAKLAPKGKEYVAYAMIHRGGNFALSGMFLEKRGGYPFVILHLLCQGLEISMKGLLLYIDYDKYEPLLKGDGKDKINHDLVKGMDYVYSEIRSKKLIGEDREKLTYLNSLYRKHLLRYASPLDLFEPPESHYYGFVGRKCIAIFRYWRRYLRKS
jgi:hypothetical protein